MTKLKNIKKIIFRAILEHLDSAIDVKKSFSKIILKHFAKFKKKNEHKIAITHSFLQLPVLPGKPSLQVKSFALQTEQLRKPPPCL